MSAILEFRNVAFAHGARPIFDNLCISVEHGETVALVGPNGVGKTTLLRLAAGLLCPSSGEVLVRGQELERWSRRQLSCAVALVPQYLEVPFAFRVEEIVAQGRVPHLGFFGRLTKNDIEAVETAMDAVDLLGMRRRVFSELSGGERQRVKIAIGLAQQARLMLLDEPTQHLDLGRQIELMGLLRKLVQRGITIVAAMHDLALVREHCSSAILLTPQAPAMAGPVKELLRADLLERAFCVARPSLERYLANEASLGAAGDGLPTAPPDADLTNDEATGQRRKNEPQEYRERLWRKDELLRCREYRYYSRHPRSGHNWDHD
jgi:iron complex transport system ATP-binding protein